MKIQTACALLACAPLLGLTTSLAPTSATNFQDNGATDTGQSQPVELPQVYFYTALHVGSYELADVAHNLYGRVVDKRDDYGRVINKRDDFGQVIGGTQNVQVLGNDRIVIFDTEERALAILDLCRKIDVVQKDVEAIERLADLSSRLTSMEYSPRYLSANDLMDALRPFQHSITDFMDPNGRMRTTAGANMNISVLGDSGQLIIRDSKEALAEITALLATLDKPSPQVQLVCYVLRGAKSDTNTESDWGHDVEAASNTPQGANEWGMSSPNIPSEVTDNLSRLVPYSNFKLATMGVLRMSTSATPWPNTLRMPGDDESFEMSLQIAAFDEAEGILSFSNFGMKKGQPMGPTNLFATATSVQAGEYAVMGAAGADPIFVVLHFEVIGK